MNRFLPRPLRCLAKDASAVAMTEFAFALPLVLLLGMTGAEYVNYTTTKMRVSQIALQVADNAARMGEGTAAGPKTISETDINDVFTGAQLQSGSLSVQANGKIILSDLEIDPNHAGKYKIMWQRCYGAQSHPSGFGTAPQYANDPNAKSYDNLAGIGPTTPVNQQVTAQAGNATMFVEVYFVYKPLFNSKFSLIPTTTFDEIASMTVRDQRDLTQILNAENVAISTCP